MIFKSIKKAFAWISILGILLVLIIGAGYVALRSPRVQTKITQQIAGYLADELETEVSIDGVDIGLFNRLILEGLYVEDLKGDTLAYLNRLHLGLNYLSLDKNQIHLSKVRIDDLKFYLHKYEGDEKLSIQFLIDYFKVSKDSLDKPVWDIRSNALELSNASFQLRNHYSKKTNRGIDYKDLDVRKINLLVEEIQLDGDTVFGYVAKLNCYENRGFFLKHLEGNAKVSPNELFVQNLKIQTVGTDVKLNLHYTYNQWLDYKSFVQNVRMDYELENSVIDLRDVAFFTKGLNGLEEKLTVSGHVYGPISSLNARNLKLSYGGRTFLHGDIDLDGLPNIQETFLHLNLKQLTTHYSDLIRVPVPPFEDGKHLPLPHNMINLGTMNFKGSFTGFLTDFVAYGSLQTALGQLRTDIALKQDDYSGLLAYSGELQSYDFDIGRFFEEEKIGKVSLDAKVKGKGLVKDEINAKLDGNVQSVELVGYDYKDIQVNGEFARSMFSGEVIAQDTNLSLIFRGGFDLSQELPQFNFHADVTHANLYELNLLRERENATVSGVVDVDFTGDDIDNLLGVIEISNAIYTQQDTIRYDVSEFELNIDRNSTGKHLNLQSDLADADFNGKFSFRNIPKAANNLLRKHLPSYAGAYKPLTQEEGLEFDFDLYLKNTELVSFFLSPELSISDSSHVHGNYSSSKNEVSMFASIPKATYSDLSMQGIQIDASNPGKEFELGLTARKLNITDSLYLKSLNINSFTFHDSLGLVVQWDNKSKRENSAFIRGVASFSKNQEASFHLEPSRVTITDVRWTVAPDNLLQVDSSSFTFNNFLFLNKGQHIGLNGVIAENPLANLDVRLKDFDLSNFNIGSEKMGLKLQGEVSGNAQVSGIYDELFFTNQLSLDSLVVNGVMIGSGELNNTWIQATKSIQVFGLIQRNNQTSLSVIGEFLPGRDRKENFNIKAAVDQIPISVCNPYVKKVLTDIKGVAKADLSLKGTLKSPELSGYVVLKKAEMLVTYLNTRFKISDTVEVRPDGFYLNDLTALDERDNEGLVSGWVKHTGFKKFHFDAKLLTQGFLALNTNSAMNSLYYGKGFGSGQVRFFGEPKDMHLEVAMKTERGTRFHIPLFGAKNVYESEFITFVKPKGLEEKIEVKDEFQVSFKNLTLDMDIEVTSDAEVQLIFDPAVGDIIKGRGDGDLSMSLDKAGNFKMFGDYYISKGEYLFTLQNIINKKFLIQQGGTINWSGDPYNALVNIDATYGVRTSLYDLMYPDTTNDSYKKRIQVDCMLKLTDNLLNPNIAFDIDLPNTDESTKTDVRNKIGVGNVQEMNRQIFGLLVLNRFFPTEDQNQALQQAGGFFTSSTSEMISNQLSNWLSKISNDFDIGLNYRPGDDITSDELQASLSTQLFNNRILIDGNVGVANTQSSSSNIVGDANIEYKITPDGRFRVRAFNKSNDINTLTDNAPFTQGVGLSYQREFDRLGDLFRRRKKEDYNKD